MDTPLQRRMPALTDLPTEGAANNDKPKVLVADDNTGLAELWSFVLEDRGYEVITAHNGGDALAAAAQHCFNAAVLDLEMPDLSGLDVFTALQADTPEIEGIIITGHASVDSAVEAVNRGIYGYLVKPVAADALGLMVGRALERQRLQAENQTMLSQLSALLEVLDTALETVGLEDAFQRMARAVVNAMGVDEVTLLLQNARRELEIRAAHPLRDATAMQFRLRPGEGFAGRVFAEKKAQQVRDIQAAGIARRAYLTMPGIRSVLGVPLLSGTEAIGVLHVGTFRERVFADQDVRLLEAIAQRLTLAVEKARLLEEREASRRELEAAYRHERRIAETLQRSFLPGVRIDIPGLCVAHLYQAGLEEAEVGGDFYDIIELGDGLVGLVMGDVSGKGLDAAVYTALAKYTLRSYALQNPDPGHVVEWLNRAFTRQSGPETFATLFYGVLDTHSRRLRYINAGHEPPLLHHADEGTTEQLASNGPLAGVLAEAEYQTQETGLAPGDTLLLYTDGASDARQDNEWLGTDGIQRLLEANLHLAPQECLAAIYAGIVAFSRSGVRDDTALMLVRALAVD